MVQFPRLGVNSLPALYRSTELYIRSVRGHARACKQDPPHDETSRLSARETRGLPYKHPADTSSKTCTAGKRACWLSVLLLVSVVLSARDSHQARGS
jgi:hypothetical protein